MGLGNEHQLETPMRDGLTDFETASNEIKESKEHVDLLAEAGILDSQGEELASCISHSVCGLVMLLTLFKLDDWFPEKYHASIVIYVVCACVLFFMSSFYHMPLWMKRPKKKLFLQKCDMTSIFFLIMGSYVPFCIHIINPRVIGLTLFTVIVVLSIIGIFAVFFKLFSFKGFVYLYLVLGWLSFAALKYIYDGVGSSWLILGVIFMAGISYSVGTWFLTNEDMNYSHLIWHVFIAFGVGLFYLSYYMAFQNIK
ncbi:hypothetical protein PCE1_001892 [Barthelona sp. PCE]